MGLSTLVNRMFERVNKPEPQKRKSKAKGYENIAPHESGVPYGNVWRLSKAFQEPYSLKFLEDHNLPPGIGTFNDNMPIPIASYMQELRNASIDPTNEDDVAHFQEMIASVSTLFMPLVLGQILEQQGKGDLYDKLSINVKFKHRETEKLLTFGKGKSEKDTLSYEEIYNPDWIPRLENTVKTIGGSSSNAHIHPNLTKYTPILEIKGNLGLKLNFIDVQRGGNLPSLIGKWIYSQMGVACDILSTDAKRRHEDNGTGVKAIDIVKPIGYFPSEHSEVVSNAFVAPNGYEKNPDIHILFDPMLATGKSARKVIEAYCKSANCISGDIYVVGLFAGSYEVFDELSEFGVNVITLAHDQADLNLQKYIQPGLGDGGINQQEKLLMEKIKLLMALVYLKCQKTFLN